MNKKILTTFLPLVISFFAFGFYNNKEASAVTYDCSICTSSERVCDNNTMCCTGNGCPSSVCEEAGFTWDQTRGTIGQCYECVPTYTKECTKYETYVKEYEYKCKVVSCTGPTPQGISTVAEDIEQPENTEDDVLATCTVCGWYPVYAKKCVAWKNVYTGTTCSWENPDPADTCRYCKVVEPPPSCTTAPITGSPSLSSPTNGQEFDSSTTSVTLSWTAPGSWGTCCNSCTKLYEVWVKTNTGSFVKKTTTSSLSYSLAVSEGNDYTWYIRATNGDATGLNSTTRTFSVLPISPQVSGYIWNSTDLSCGADKASNEISPADLDSSISVSAAGISGTWDPATFTSYSYEVTGLTDGNDQIVCANVPAPADAPNFKYSLSCLNSSDTDIISDSCGLVDILGDTTAHLGFELASRGWFNVIAGDVYGGCSECIESVSIGIPTTPLGGFVSALIDAPGTIFGNSNLSVKDGDGNDRFTSDSNNYFVENMESNFWQESFRFLAPADANEVSDCNGLLGSLTAGQAYTLSRSCMQSALDNLSGSYSVSGDGIATLFVEGDGTNLSIDSDLQSSSSNSRIVIVTDASIDVSSDLGAVSPTPSTRPNIEASLISQNSINFLTTGASDDTTVVVEGPIVAKDGSIDFGRDRGLQNGYPAEVVVYNPIYLTGADAASDTGLGVVDITWTLY